MPGCSAEWCTGSSTNGKKMSIFPKEPRRRKLWTDIVNKHNRPNWMPTAYSYLCEVHFAAEMWEKERQDGKKKLKGDAFPTIFKNTICQSPLTNRSSAYAEQCAIQCIKQNADEAEEDTQKVTDQDEHENVCVDQHLPEVSWSKQDLVKSTSNFSHEPSEMEIVIDKESILTEYDDVLASRRKNRATSRKFADVFELRRLRRQLRISENLRRQLISTFIAGKERRNLIIRRLKKKIKRLEELSKLTVDVASSGDESDGKIHGLNLCNASTFVSGEKELDLLNSPQEP